MFDLLKDNSSFISHEHAKGFKFLKITHEERDLRLWDSLYSLTKSGIKIKSFQLTPDFIPLKEQMKDVNGQNR